MTVLSPLAAYRQFIPVLLVPRPDGKTDKFPIDHRTGNVTAKGGEGAHDPAIWLSWAEAAEHAKRLGEAGTVGFVLTAADPFWCLDIDGAYDIHTGQWSTLSRQLVAALPGAAVEVSQSGRGLHLWGQGAVPEHSKKNVALHIELYTERRFIALGRWWEATGDMSQPCPGIANVAAAYFPARATAGEVPDDGPSPDWRGPTDDEELLRRAMQSRSTASVFGDAKATFADLWLADDDVLAKAYPPDSNSSEPYDRSSADAALAQHLAFWTGRDVARMERLMRRSALTRTKWDERDDYLVERTIMGACARQRDVLQDKPSAIESAPTAAAAAGAVDVPRMSTVEGSTFLGPDQQADLFKGCIYVMDRHRVLVPGGHLLNPDRFRAHFGGYTFAMDARNEKVSRNAWEAFTESQVLRAPRVDGTCFKPNLPYGAIVEDAGRRRVNTFHPVQVRRVKGDPSKFLEHVAKLLPVKGDQEIILAYMAACVQHMGYKFQWAPLVQGVEGNGKTFLSRCVAEAVGKRYVHWPKASKIAKQFNAWMVGRVFYAVEDIHTSAESDVLDELKPMITGGDGLEIEAKGVDQTSEEICGNFLFNSNHKTGLRKTRNDRRFCVLFTAQQQVEDLARDGMDGDYMRRLYDWAKHEDGVAIVSEFLFTYPIPDRLNPATGCQRAPRSSTTDAAIELSLGRIEQEIMEAVEQGEPGFAGGWISSVMLDQMLQRMGRAGSVPPNRRREMLQGLGYDWHEGLVATQGRVDNVVAPDAKKPKLFILRGHPANALRGSGVIARAYQDAQGVAAPRPAQPGAPGR